MNVSWPLSEYFRQLRPFHGAEILSEAGVPPYLSGPRNSHSAGWKAQSTASAGLQCKLHTMLVMSLRPEHTGERPFILALGSKWSVIGQLMSFFILHRCCVSS